MSEDIIDQTCEDRMGNELAPTDYENLEENIRKRLIVEIFHNFGCMANRVYYTKYETNAEVLDRDLKVWRTWEQSRNPKVKKSSKP